jgi:hypothetical protein
MRLGNIMFRNLICIATGAGYLRDPMFCLKNETEKNEPGAVRQLNSTHKMCSKNKQLALSVLFPYNSPNKSHLSSSAGGGSGACEDSSLSLFWKWKEDAI